MAQIINTNLSSINAQRNLNKSQSEMATAVQRLSSGLRVNSSKDDAAGLAIADRMQSQIRGMNVAIRNANDGISLAQVADGAFGQLSDIVQRMRELAVQSANATNNDKDRESLNQEYTQLIAEIQRTIQGTTFNGRPILFDGAGTQTFQVGAGTTENDKIDITSANLMDEPSIQDVLTTDILTPAETGQPIAGTVDEAINRLDAMLDTINAQRAVYGAVQNRFSSVIATLQVSAENQTAARSRIMDADFAAETAALSRAQILQQAGTAMVAQANQLPQNVLSLLKG
ncbi:MAG: flagellin [Burkholderiaceae bacterium]